MDMNKMIFNYEISHINSVKHNLLSNLLNKMYVLLLLFLFILFLSYYKIIQYLLMYVIMLY